MMELTEQAQAALADAKRLAKRLGDNYIGTEHLLVALVRQEDSLAAKVLQGLGVSEKNRCCRMGRQYTKVRSDAGTGRTGSHCMWYG